MVIHNPIMNIPISIVNIRNSIMDIFIMDIFVMDIFITDIFIMDIFIRDIHNFIMGKYGCR